MMPPMKKLIEEHVSEVETIKAKMKHHDNESKRLGRELGKHLKTSAEYRQLKNDVTHHNNAYSSYKLAGMLLKDNSSPSSVKAKIKSAENHASKVSGKIPEPAKRPERIKDVHTHVHKLLTDRGFSHSSSTEEETTHSTRRMTPYGDDTPFSQRGKRTNTTHVYVAKGTKEDAGETEKLLRQHNVLGERGNHNVSVRHSKNKVEVTHRVTGASKPDHSFNKREYDYHSGAGNDPLSWGTHYDAWRKGKSP